MFPKKEVKTILLFSIFLSLSSCGTFLKKTSSGSEAKEENIETPSVIAPLPPDIYSTELPGPKKIRWGVKDLVVWVEAIGVDVYYQLGFLQELEKSDFKIKKIYGTGFGCWLAQSWASEGKGSYAEWQSFKLSNWDFLKGDFFSKFGGSLSYKTFAKNIRNSLPPRRKSQFKMDYDCPYMDTEADDGAGKLRSSRSDKLPRELWTQITIPQLIDSLKIREHKKRSGLYMPPPNRKDLERWISFLPYGKKNTSAFLYLSTPRVRKEFRGRRSGGQMTRVPGSKLRWIKLEVGGRTLGSADAQKNFSQRRRFMLEGRKEAKRFLESARAKDFLVRK